MLTFLEQNITFTEILTHACDVRMLFYYISREA